VTLEFIRFLEDSQHFQYVQREVVADDPEWLSEDGFWGGVRAQLKWKRDFVVSNPSLNREVRARHRDSINDLLSSVDDRQDEVPTMLLSEIRQMADDLLLALNRPAPEAVSGHR